MTCSSLFEFARWRAFLKFSKNLTLHYQCLPDLHPDQEHLNKFGRVHYLVLRAS